mmetsp:Transcript_44942/g.121076  ORF Transcript_44942/g.121076 Transcript_44942/m.121076 type:complete len:245 (+) Transcript_44942:129-863(+)
MQRPWLPRTCHDLLNEVNKGRCLPVVDAVRRLGELGHDQPRQHNPHVEDAPSDRIAVTDRVLVAGGEEVHWEAHIARGAKRCKALQGRVGVSGGEDGAPREPLRMRVDGAPEGPGGPAREDAGRHLLQPTVHTSAGVVKGNERRSALVPRGEGPAEVLPPLQLRGGGVEVVRRVLKVVAVHVLDDQGGHVARKIGRVPHADAATHAVAHKHNVAAPRPVGVQDAGLDKRGTDVSGQLRRPEVLR